MLIGLTVLPTLAVADLISISVPSVVANAVADYRADCAEHGGELELDGDEVFKLWTDEGDEAYVIHAAFTCSHLGHLWCGSAGCPTQLVIANKLYETNRILREPPNRISHPVGEVITYWVQDGLSFKISE